MSEPPDPLFPEDNEEAKAEGNRRRDEAMERADQHASPPWQAATTSAIRWVAERRPELTADPIWTMLDAWGVDMPHEPRALGPLMKAAARSGWIEHTGRWHRSVRPQNHRRWVAIWRSHLFGKERTT